ncbi:MAG: caspase family protein [Rivularia sp. (in: cyanobacteria)]
MTQRNLAIVIGINAYENGISPLKTPVNDAIGVAEVLNSLYKYEVKQLLNSEATLEGLNNLLENLKAGTLTLSDGRTVQVTSYQRVLLYFAGHGITEDAFENKNGPAGYLLPQDAQKTDKSTFLPMRELHDVLVELECRHLLVILDCCFAGAFRFLRNLVPFQKLYRERYDRFMKGKAQQMIASAAYDEKALDVLTRLCLRENKNTRKHSPFAEVLLKALHGAADIIPDGVITASELYIYLEKELAEVTSRQTPGLYTLKHHEKGEYIFQIPGFVADNLEKAPPLDENSNPYRGLESFNEEHKDLFFGRESVINELYFYLYEFKCTAKELIFCTKLTSELFITWLSIIILRSHIKQPSLMIVNGASGTGKSSLVKAGLLPCLRDDGWYIVSPFRPGKSPFLALTQAILLTVVIREASVIKAKFSKNFNQSKYCCNLFIEVIVFIINIFAGILEEYNDQKIINSLSEVLQKNLKSLTKLAQISNIENSAKLLLVIDQFEELVTVCSEEEKENFLTWLEKSVIENSETVRVIITLRSDFKAQFSKLFDVKRFIDVAQFTVPIMTQDEFREIIEKPATEKVLYFEPPELVDELINEVVQMPGALPLLSFTLSQLYLRCCDRWQEGETNRAITLEDYKQLDGVMGSLKKTATDVFEKLINEKKATEQSIRHVMLRMVSVSGDELARRRVLESELEYPEPKNSEAKEVIKAFTDARLLVKGTSDNGEAYVEPAHDALVNGWNQILVWKNQQQENLLLQRGLTPAVMEWRNIEQRHNKVEPLLNFLDKGLDLIDDLWNFSKTLLRLIRRNSQEKKQKSLKKSRFLWDSNPRLNLLEEVLDSSDNWLSKMEIDFVRNSIKKNRRNIAFVSGSVFVFILGLGTFSIFALNGQRNALIGQVRSSQQSSEALFRSGDQQLEALIAALSAGTNLQSNWLLRLREPEQELQNEVKLSLWKAFYQTPEEIYLWHKDKITSASFSPDGKKVVTTSFDKTVKIWNLQGQLLNTIKEDEDIVIRAFFSFDSTKIVTASSDGKARVWNLQGKLLAVFKGHQGWVTSASFSPDGNKIVTASFDETAKIWDVQGNLLKTLKGHQGHVYSAFFSPSGEKILTASEDKTAKIWNLQGKLLTNIQGHQGHVYTAFFSPDNKKIVTASEDETAKIWNIEGKLLATIQGHQGQVNSAFFSPNGEKIVTASEDKTVKIWNLKGQLLSSLDRHKDWVNSALFNPDATKIITASADGTAKVWNIQNELLLDGHQSWVTSASFSPDNKKIITTSGDKTAKMWNFKGKPIVTLHGHRNVVWSASFSPDGKNIVTASHDKTAKLWNLKGEVLVTFRGHKDVVWNAFFSPDGKKIISTSRDKTSKLWNLKGEVLTTLKGHTESVDTAKFSPDDESIITASDDGTVRIWNLQGKQVSVLQESVVSVDNLAFSPDGRFIVTASGGDSTAKVWNLQGKLLATMEGHTGAVNSAEFSSDGNYIVTASEDKTVKLWNLQGKILVTIKGHTNAVNTAAFSPDNNYILTASQDKTAKLWKFPLLPELTAQACTTVKYYLRNYPDVDDTHRNLCDGIPEPTRSY